MHFKAARSIDDYKLCADIWLEASLKAHAFIDADFWLSKHLDMAEIYLPASDVMMIALDNETPAAFFAVVDNKLEALFARPSHWGLGLGRALLSRLLAGREQCGLTVYAENGRAIDFYLKNGFIIKKFGQCPYSGADEIEMIWSRPGRK